MLSTRCQSTHTEPENRSEAVRHVIPQVSRAASATGFFTKDHDSCPPAGLFPVGLDVPDFLTNARITVLCARWSVGRYLPYKSHMQIQLAARQLGPVEKNPSFAHKSTGRWMEQLLHFPLVFTLDATKETNKSFGSIHFPCNLHT